jgi:acyl-CoA thioester hydrolase
MAVFKTTYRVTWSDTDAAQVVHHSNYFRLFERAEEEFYEHLGFRIDSLAERGLWLPRIEVYCKYRAPSRFGDVLEISMVLEDLKRKTVKYGFEVRRQGAEAILAEGYVVAANADKELGRAIDIPPEIAEKLKKFMKS